MVGKMKRKIRWIFIGGLVIFIAIQAVPYGHGHLNPPVRVEPKWNNPVTRELAVRACFDCHSNQTVWPWYSYVAPASWLVQRHVEEGREELNFSEWDLPQDEAEEAAEEVLEGNMPMRNYVWLHPEAKLTDSERQALARGLEATFGVSESDREFLEKPKVKGRQDRN